MNKKIKLSIKIIIFLVLIISSFYFLIGVMAQENEENKMMFAFVDKVTGEIGGGGSGIYDVNQQADGSTMKERVEVLKAEYAATHDFYSWPAEGDKQPSAEKHHVVNGILVDWTDKEKKQRKEKKLKESKELKKGDVTYDIMAEALSELRIENGLLKTELCNKDSSFSWCLPKIMINETVGMNGTMGINQTLVNETILTNQTSFNETSKETFNIDGNLNVDGVLTIGNMKMYQYNESCGAIEYQNGGMVLNCG